MTRIDTIEFTTNTEFIESMNTSSFTISNIHKPNGNDIVKLFN